MKVLMIEPLGFSGICYCTNQLCHTLTDLGIDVVLLTSRNYELVDQAHSYKVYAELGGMERSKGRVARGIDYLIRLKNAVAIIKQEKPDIVHFQDSLIPAADIALIVWLRSQGITVVYTAHDVDRSSLRYTSRLRIKLNQQIYKLLYHAVEHIIVHSNIAQNELTQHFRIAATKIQKVALGNLSRRVSEQKTMTREEAREHLGIPLNSVTALFFGDRRWSKGLDLLIESSEEVTQRVPHYFLLIAGEARVEHKVDYPALLRRHHLETNSLFVDQFIPEEQVPIYLLAADFLVLPYRKIYQSAVVQLAYSYGKPVIAARLGGLAEVVEENETGWFVEDVSNTHELAEKIIFAATHPDQVCRFGQRAKALAVTKYSWTSIGKHTVELYKSWSNQSRSKEREE